MKTFRAYNIKPQHDNRADTVPEFTAEQVRLGARLLDVFKGNTKDAKIFVRLSACVAK